MLTVNEAQPYTIKQIETTSENNREMSLLNPNANTFRGDLETIQLGDDFFKDFHDPFPGASPQQPIHSQRPHPATHHQSRSDSLKTFDCAGIVNHAIELSNNNTNNEPIPLQMNAGLDDMDDDLSAAEFNPALLASTIGTNNFEADMTDDDLSLAEFHPPSAEPAPLPSMVLCGNQALTDNNIMNNMNNSPIGNNRWRGIAAMNQI